jgi:hypothetical protein
MHSEISLPSFYNRGNEVSDVVSNLRKCLAHINLASLIVFTSISAVHPAPFSLLLQARLQPLTTSNEREE